MHIFHTLTQLNQFGINLFDSYKIVFDNISNKSPVIQAKRT